MREPFVGPLPPIRGTQIGFSHPDQIDAIKQEMLTGSYVYDFVLGKVAGVVDARGVHYVKVGHHRMAAALEIMRETGNDRYVRLLLENGSWENVAAKPNDGRPMPARHWWGWLLNRFWP